MLLPPSLLPLLLLLLLPPPPLLLLLLLLLLSIDVSLDLLRVHSLPVGLLGRFEQVGVNWNRAELFSSWERDADF